MRRPTRTILTALAVASLTLFAGVGVAGAAEQRTDTDFHAIVALSNCSGSVFRFADTKDSAQALVLTNGHCIGSFPDPGEVIKDQPSSRTFDLLDSTGDDTLGTLTAERLVVATMTDTDAAVYRLEETYADLESAYDTEALVVSEEFPVAGTDIDVVSGYWQEMYSCSIDGFVYRLEEGGYTFKRSIRYTDGCDTIGGTSGSPIIDSDTGEIIGINNTANEDTGAACSLDNPCEVDRDGNVSDADGTKYGQQTYKLRSLLAKADA